MFIRSTGEPVLAQTVGHSEDGDACCRISYEREGKTVVHDHAFICRLSLPGVCSPPRPIGGFIFNPGRATACVHHRPKRSL